MHAATSQTRQGTIRWVENTTTSACDDARALCQPRRVAQVQVILGERERQELAHTWVPLELLPQNGGGHVAIRLRVTDQRAPSFASEHGGQAGVHVATEEQPSAIAGGLEPLTPLIGIGAVDRRPGGIEQPGDFLACPAIPRTLDLLGRLDGVGRATVQTIAADTVLDAVEQ